MLQRSLSVEEICRKLKPLFGNKIDQLYLRYSTSDSFDEKNEILQALIFLYQKNLNKLLDNSILLEPPEKAEISGEYPLGEVVYAGKRLHSFGLNEKDWQRHVCITGMSGSGKTNFAFKILENFIEKDKPFLVFDWKKSFRPLVHIDPSLFVFTIGNDSVSNLFKTNINIPPTGDSPKEWISVLADLLAESFSASFGVHKIILETLDEIFEGCGVYQGSQHYPNWLHIKKMLEIKAKESRGRESQWYESALRIASVLTFGNFGKVINYEGKKSLSIEDIFDKRIVFELNSLGNIQKKFFCEFVLTYIYKHKKVIQNKVNETFNYAILVDEAHNVFLKDKTNFVSESITDMAYREMREYGISLICLDQNISKLSDTVKGNSACHVAFQQQLPQDIYDLSSITQLQQNKDFFSKIPVGSAIVKLSERYTSPFLIETPLIKLREENIEDSKISSRMSCMVSGIEAEKNDPEFMDSLVNKKFSEKVKSSEIGKGIMEVKKTEEEIYEIEISNEIPKEDTEENSKLTPAQKIPYDFAYSQLEKEIPLNQIERVLESRLSEKCYTESDIFLVIDSLMRFKLEKKYSKVKEESLGKKEINSDRIKEYPFLKILNSEERKFMLYLMENPNHKDSTVEVYKKAGLSTRKGNIIKNSLLNKELIKIQEEKNSNGWKKYIKLANNLN